MSAKFLIAAVLVSLIAVSSMIHRTDRPDGLMVNLLRDPGDALITEAQPSFCWVVPELDASTIQQAYQILVGTDSASVAAGKGSLWDSGKTEDERSCNVPYRGFALNSNHIYWWSVKVWTEKGSESRFSFPQKFITGTFTTARDWPGESRWQNEPDGQWRLENRQRGHYFQKHPVALREVMPGHYMADFGKAAFGTFSATIYTPTSGDTIWLHLAERITDTYVTHKNPGRTNIAYRKDYFITREGWHTYHLQLPRHVSHYPNSQVLADHMPEVIPFRYVELFGVPGSINKSSLTQHALYYYFDEEASHFISSNDNLNRIWELCKYTLKATPFLSLYADGNRERMPYEADAFIQQMGHYSVDREYSVARYTWQFLLYNASWPTEWQFHTLMMAWQDYMYTGNSNQLRQHYDELRKKTLIGLAREDGLISTRDGKATKEFQASIHYHGDIFGDIVDWPPGSPKGQKAENSYQGRLAAGERDNYDFRKYNTVVNAFHYHSLEIMSQVAAVTGHSRDADFFSKRATDFKSTFNAHFLDAEKGIYRDGIGSDHYALHASMFPLAFGLVPENHIDSVIDFIQSKGMVCGVYGAQYLLEGLFDHGAGDYALQLMVSEDVRSWMNMIRVGSTMTTEAWDEFYKPNLTWNHAWGSAPANMIMRKIAGVEPVDPGFATFRIQPHIDLLDFASFKVPTIKGSVFVKWEKTGDGILLHIHVPANTEASLYLPGRETTELGPGHFDIVLTP